MSKEIRRGDLVVVVRGHSCIVSAFGGMVFTVSGFEPPRSGWFCSRCRTKGDGPNETAATGLGVSRIPVSWLERIPPLAELSSETQRDEVTV